MARRTLFSKLFPLWTVGVAVVSATAISGRFAEYHQVFDVTVTGSGSPVLLIPGLATSGEVWDSTVARLQDSHQLHVLTLAGFGGPEPLGEPFLPRVASAIVEYVDENRLDRPILVGHSLGGFVAFLAASEAPQAFGGVVAVDGVPFLPALLNADATAAAQVDQATAVRSFYDSLDREQFLAQTSMALSSMMTDSADVERARGWAAKTEPRAAGIAVAELMTTDLRQRVARITTPVLLIGALGAAPEPMRDTFRAAYHAQVAALPAAQVVFAESARHFVMIDDPGFFFATLEGFLEQAARTQGVEPMPSPIPSPPAPLPQAGEGRGHGASETGGL
jgi:N-formylmaleamate deformylase